MYGLLLNKTNIYWKGARNSRSSARTCSETAVKLSQRSHGIALWTYIVPMPFLQSLGVLHNAAAMCGLCGLERINFVRRRLQDLVVKRLQKPSLSEATVPS
jgi:hypothetical protein